MTFFSTCETFKSSTCHMIVHCCLYMVLFATQWSKLFSLNSHSFSVSDNSLQKSYTAWSVPYRAFLSLTYNMGLSCLFFHMYFLYSFGLNLMIIFAIVPSSSICTSLFMSKCIKTPGMLVTAIYLLSFASMAQDSVFASSDTFGHLVSDLSCIALVTCHMHILLH